ncbi:MAG: ABC transporter ATP-binding protein [Nitrososphaeraceae archaeon]|jgi:ABC-2 type transport system ATP-binding protein
MKVIEALGLTKSYKGSKNPALNDISLSIDSRQIFTMLGRNGAGKTTFVRICATQLMPSSGRLSVLGHDIVKYPDKVRNQISAIPQEGRPLRALTPWDHVYNWLRIRGESNNIAREKAVQILKKLDLYDARNVPAMNLSGGMKQKVLVAMALAPEAQLLFLDEPTIGLDPVSRRQVWSAIKDWKDQDRTILLTTHYMDEAELLADYIVIIDKGNIIAKGTMNELRKIVPYELRIDVPKINLDKSLMSLGSVVDSGANFVRIFIYETDAEKIYDKALRMNTQFTVSPITLDDVFVYLVGKKNNDDNIKSDNEI